MRIFRKSIISLTLAATLFSSAIITEAAVTKSSGEVLINHGSTYANYAKVTITEIDDKVYPIVESQAEHKQGITTTISVNSSVTKTETASASFTTGYDGMFAKLEAEIGVSYSESMTVGSSVSYTLTNQQSGKYRIEVVYPRYKVNEKVIKRGQSGVQIVYDKTIQTAPKKAGQYKRCRRYAD